MISLYFSIGVEFAPKPDSSIRCEHNIPHCFCIFPHSFCLQSFWKDLNCMQWYLLAFSPFYYDTSISSHRYYNHMEGTHRGRGLESFWPPYAWTSWACGPFVLRFMSRDHRIHRFCLQNISPFSQVYIMLLSLHCA